MTRGRWYYEDILSKVKCFDSLINQNASLSNLRSHPKKNDTLKAKLCFWVNIIICLNLKCVAGLVDDLFELEPQLYL